MVNRMHEMRENYDRAELTEHNIDSDPILQFKTWFEDAKNEDIKEPNAMILSTVDEEGHPSSRTVLLKELEDEGFIFYTNYESDKAKHMVKNPHVSLLFFWQKVERQVRISGIASKITKEKSNAYFRNRPRGSQIGAWTSPQSQPIEDRMFLEQRKKEIESKFSDVENLPLPEFWGGYIVNPISIEFWQGRPDRLHDRIKYSRSEGRWKIVRLAP